MAEYAMKVLPKPSPSTRDRRQAELDGLRRHPAKDYVTSVAINEVQEDELMQPHQPLGPHKATGPKRNPSEAKKHARQNSLRHANSVELMHKRWRSGSGPHVAPEGDSGGRSGHQFTVGNVGSNGAIFLRPVVRPATKRASPPQFVFPPRAAEPRGHSAAAAQTHSRRRSNEGLQDLSASGTQTPTQRTPTRQLRRSSQHEAVRPGSPHLYKPQHNRTQSCSTIDDKARAHNTDAGGFRVVIDRPQQPRPRTADGPSPPTLEVQIPHYRLGTPRFSVRGTAFLRSSVYTRTSTNDDLRSSVFSQGNFHRLFPVPPGMERPALSNKWDSRPSASTSQGMASPGGDVAGRVIEPSIYDDLTFGPKADSPAVIRYCPTTGAIVAATPARLISQITSPNFLDYELLSDFFLTYRSFMSPYDLVAYLMARMQWASARRDEVGKIVRVRTFVAMRHWILNYFIDDFVPDFTLRAAFCESLNLLCNFLKQTLDSSANAFKIIGQLKKCWRRTFALYWDGDTSADDSDADEEIYPGGVAGSRQDQVDTPRLTAGLPIDAVVPAQIEAAMTQHGVSLGKIQGSGGDGRVDSQDMDRATAKGHSFDLPALSPTSEMSAPVLSCSFPAKTAKRAPPTTKRSPAPYPVHVVAAPSAQGQPHAAPPSPLAKKGRPGHARKRSGSFTDALRDNRTLVPYPAAVSRGAQILMAFPFAESFIRGNVCPPPQPFVTDVAPLTPTERLRTADFFSPVDPSRNIVDPSRGHGTAPGMKKLFGSVRRAWSTKTPTDSPNSSIAAEIGSSVPLPNVKGSQCMRPSTAHAKPAQKTPAARVPLRVDLLAAKISEAFKKLAKEQESALEQRKAIQDRPGPQESGGRYEPDASRQQEINSFSTRPPPQSVATNGSRSIVIIDETGDSPRIAMSGALRYSSIDSAVEDESTSSVLHRPSFEAEESVPLVYDRDGHSVSSDAEGRDKDSIEPVPPIPQHILERNNISMRPGPSPMITTKELPSSLSRGKSFKSINSTSLRRLASYQSEVSRRAKESFDATTATDNDSFRGSLAPKPDRVLRRRPGGDLRAARKVNDLEHPMRPRSTGSLATHTGSICSSTFPASDEPGLANAVSSPSVRRRYSLGALAGNTGKGTSLIQTHSSQPNLRPSFEAEVAKLAQLPDDEEDDGGIESTLLKLEGRFERTGSGEFSPPPFFGSSPDQSGSDRVLSTETSGGYDSDELRARQEHAYDQLASAVKMPHQPSTRDAQSSQESAEPNVSGLRPRDKSHHVSQPPRSSIASEDSYSSIPLLERGLADKPLQLSNQTSRESDAATPGDFCSKSPHLQVQKSEPSFEYIEETDSMRNIPQGATMPPSDIGQGSFLLDDDEDLSDISSDISAEIVHRPPMSRESSSTFPGAILATQVSELPAAAPVGRAPPSPPLTTEKTMSMAGSAYANQFQNRPPTPVRTPTTRDPLQRTISMPKLHNAQIEQPSKLPNQGSAGLNNNSVHMCFILEYDSEVIAQQFTLIEKYALNEIDWRELVDMRSKDAASPATDWVDFLKSGEQSGVELVIARFNIMVKWALSEIVMTQSMEERARTITKYIHISAHARRFRNYATMYQLIIALMSTDCSRLAKTWQMVSPTDVQIFKELEALVQPMRNFHKLRVEMESSLAEGGCIPFIGVYTHDLVFNAQRPNQADLTQHRGEPLVNFERHRTTAAVVKSLLRLLESSSRYDFPPVEDVISKCLWMARLPDDEIHKLSKQLE